jgi:hypothetical protein
MSPLERRYRWLLRTYPNWYRRDQGEDMLGTLLDGEAGGGSWPAPREALALVIGGLRVRSTRKQSLTIAANLRLAALFGVMLVLVGTAARQLGFEVLEAAHTLPADSGFSHQNIAGLLGLAAVVAVWLRQRVLTTALALASAVAILAWTHGPAAGSLLPVLLLVALVALSLGARRMPWLWLWGTGVAFLIGFLLTLAGFLRFAPAGLHEPVQYLAWALYAIAVLWVVVDPRPAIAMAVYLAVTYDITDGFNGLTYHIVFGPAWTWILPAASSVGLLAGATWLLRRQAVT